MSPQGTAQLAQWLRDFVFVRGSGDDEDARWCELLSQVADAITALAFGDGSSALGSIETACELERQLTGDDDLTAELCRALGLDPDELCPFCGAFTAMSFSGNGRSLLSCVSSCGWRVELKQ